MEQNAIEPMCKLLTAQDVKIVTVALEGLENMLRVAQSQGYLEHVVNVIEGCNGTQTIEDLQNHDNKSIYTRATSMLETYFGAEEVDETEMMPNVVTDSTGHQQFGFGGPSNTGAGGFKF